MDKIKAMPNSTCFLAKFSSVDTALEVLGRLSFVETDPQGIALPTGVMCEVFETLPGAMVVIGGMLSAQQRAEIFSLFEEFGQIEAIALPPEAEQLKQQPRRKLMMSKALKTAFLAALLMGAGYFLGTVCTQFGQAYELILSPSEELLDLLLRFLLALGAMAVTAGLVAALLRPVWVGIIAFAFSALTMLLGWQVSPGSCVLVLVYVLVASLYTVSVARELNERIKFSVGTVTGEQGMLLMALVLVACGSLYLGYAAHIEREGFSVPELYIEMFMEQMEKQIVSRAPEAEREEMMAEFREEFRHTVDEFFEQTVKPHEKLIPLSVAAGIFTPLVTVTRLLSWVPTMVLNLVFYLLTVLGVIKVVCETQEVQRLVID
jgi:hypothetical protein